MKSHRWLKRITILMTVLILLSIAIPLAAPLVLSTPWGTKQLVAAINRWIPGSVSVQKLHLSWFSHQEIQGLELRDPDGNVVVSVDQLISDLRPYQLLSTIPKLSNSRVTGLKGTVIQDAAGTTNLHRALGMHEESESTHASSPKAKAKEWKVNMPFTGTVSVVDSSLKWLGVEMDPLEITDFNLVMQSESVQGPLNIALKGNSRQKDLQGSFVVKGLLEGFSSAGELRLQPNHDGWPLPVDGAKITVDASVSKLAVDVIDRLLTLKRPEFSGAISAALGPSLDLNVTQALSQDGLSIALKANSQNVSAFLHTQTEGGHIVLREAGKLHWTMTPDFAKHLIPLAPNTKQPVFQLLRPTQLQASLDHLQLNPGKQTPEMLSSPIRLQWTLGESHVQVNSGQELLISQGRGVIERSAGSKVLASEVTALISSGGQATDIAVKGQWQDVMALQGDVALSVKQLPTSAFSAWTDQAGLLGIALGPVLDLNATLTNAVNQKPVMSLQLVSDRVSIPNVKLSWGESLTLLEPVQAQLVVHPTLLHKLSSESALGLKAATPIKVNVTQFTLPIRKNNTHILDASFQADVSASSVALSAATGTNAQRLTVSPFRLDLNGSPTRWKYQVALNAVMDDSATQATTLVGKSVKGTFEGEIDWRDRAQRGHRVIAALNSTVMDFRGHFRLQDLARLELTKPASLHYTLQPRALETLGVQTQSIAKLMSAVLLDTQIDTFSTPLQGFSLDALQVAGRSNIDEISVKDPGTGSVASCKNLAASWFFDGPSHVVSGSVKGQSTLDKQASGTLEAVVRVQGWGQQGQTDWEKAKVHAKGSLMGFPVAMASAFSGKPELPALLGSKLDIYFVAKSTPEDPQNRGQAEFSIAGDGVAAGLALTWTDHVTFKEDSTALKWTVTPARFAALQRLATGKLPGWAIQEPTVLDLRIPQLSLPATPLSLSSWQHMKANFSGNLGAMTVTHLSSGVKSLLPPWELLANSNDLAEKVNLSLMTEDVAEQQMRVAVTGTLAAKQFTLTKPLVVTLPVMPGVAQVLFAELLPLFQTAINSDQPMRLTVDPEGFMLPVDNISARTVRIGSAALALGRVNFRNTGPLSTVVSLLDRGSTASQFPIWFTPVYFSLIDGVFRLERFDAQIADKYPIAVWGKVDLPRDRVNITVGITAQALQASYGLANLDPNTMLQLSLTGTTQNASIDKTKAAARITSLVAQGQGSPHGMIIGEVLDLIGGGADESRIPPPTSNIPWQTDADRARMMATPQKREPVQVTVPLEAVQKTIKEGANKIMNLFR